MVFYFFDKSTAGYSAGFFSLLRSEPCQTQYGLSLAKIKVHSPPLSRIVSFSITQ